MTRRGAICLGTGLLLSSLAAGTGLSRARTGAAAGSGKPALSVDLFRLAEDGIDWSPAFNRALVQARRQRRNLELAPSPNVLPLLSAIEIIPDGEGWTPIIDCGGNRFKLGNVGAGFRYRGRKDLAAENPLAGGLRDCVIDYDNVGDPRVNSGARGVFISNGGGDLLFERVRGVNMFFGCHIQNWRYADGGRPGGGITTRDCDCRGAPASDRSHKWYPFSDQGDNTIEMPGDVVPPGTTAVIATPEDRATSFGTRRAARTMFWANNSNMPIRVPKVLSAASLAAAGLTQGKETATLHGQTVDAVTYAYRTSGGTRQPDCVVQAETGLIDGADHDGGYYGTILSGTREYAVNRFRSRNNVRGFAGQIGARNVHLNDVRIGRSLSSAILAGYNCPGWTVDDFVIEASNERWIGEALVNFQLGAAGAVIGRGRISMGNDQRTGQYAIKFGPNSPGCRIDGPLTVSGDCAKAYIAVESAWDRSLSAKHKESYPQTDYRGIASVPMSGIALRNIVIDADSVNSRVATAIAVIQASDGSTAEGYHGEVGVLDMVIENVRITSAKHVADLKIVGTAGQAGRRPAVHGVSLRNFRTPAGEGRGGAKIVVSEGLQPFACVENVTDRADYCR